MNKAVFLDRDGVLNALVYRPEEDLWDSPYSLEEFQTLPGGAEAVKILKELQFLVIVVSNQPGVAKGKCRPELLNMMDREIQRELGQQGASLDGIYYCLHHPSGIVEPYGRVCDCRKPKPGLLFKAAQEHDIDLSGSYLVGDRMVDLEAGQAAGCRTILIDKSPAGGFNSTHRVEPDWIAEDLVKAARKIQQEEAAYGDLPGLG